MRAQALPWSDADRLRDHARALDRVARIRASLDGMAPTSVPKYEAEIDQLLAGTDERVSWSFGEDVDTQFRHDELTSLLRGDQSVAASMARRLELSRRVFEETISNHADAWREARRRVAEAPLYGGLQLAEQVGLVPLGVDPRSGLEEFLLWETHPGAPPRRGADGQLVLGEDAGIVLVLLPPGRLMPAD